MFKNIDGTWNKDFIFKVLFAIELALLPMLISVKLLSLVWGMVLVVVLIMVIKLIMLLIKDQTNKNHIYFDAIGNAIVLPFSMIAFACFGYLEFPLAITTSIFVIAEEYVRVYFYLKPNRHFVDSLNFACEMFMFLVLGSMIVIEFGTIMFKIAVVTLLISCVLLVAIQGYHFVYYYVFKKNKKTRKRK